jgi:protein-S-isoprenylcysteine O-methyltransferase Ste14
MSWSVANAIVTISWIGLLIAFTIASTRARWMRRGESVPGKRHHGSLAGLLLQGIGMAVAVSFSDPSIVAESWRLLLASILGPVGAVLAAMGPLKLGRHLRGQAIVTDNHELITAGAYSYFRHPLYAGVFWLTLATALVRSSWGRLAIGMAVYVAGTEIRVRVEDALLSARFPDAAREYQHRVRAYLPFIR